MRLKKETMVSHSCLLPPRRGPMIALLATAFLAHPCVGNAARAGQQTQDQPTEQTAPDESRPMPVTTDSPEFCGTLLRAIDSKTAEQPLPANVMDLRQEGIGLCQHGKVRMGIVRLRRALMALCEERNDR